MATTQDDRLLKLKTPLGQDFLLANTVTMHEGLSHPFRFELDVLHEENAEGPVPTSVDPLSLLDQSITLEITQPDGTSRFYNGIANNFSQGSRNGRFTFYSLTVVPKFWKLSQIQQSRIFQRLTVKEILEKVLVGFDVKYELMGQYHKREYCAQYKETDLDFACRLMEEEGMFYYFEHSDGNHKMIVADTPGSHMDIPKSNVIDFGTDVDREKFKPSINTWHMDYQLQTGKITYWDHHFQLHKNKLSAEQPTLYPVGSNSSLERYVFQGGYAREFDGIDKGGGDQPAELNHVFTENKKIATLSMEELDSKYKTATGTSDCSAMTAGYRFKMVKHPNGSMNGQYIITHITHTMEQSPSYTSDEPVLRPYANQFRCQSFGANSTSYRPPKKTPKPVMPGSQTAYVVGPPGEEIFTDKYGRVKVQFHWDREGKYDDDSSCWIRVGTLWAGKQWGVIHIPRIGQEVIVDFIEGDPDQPIIVGSVYNPETMPPYTLPDNKTQSGVKSRSSKGGSDANFNEFRFEDLKGQEEIYLHAEKNWTIMVENDKNQVVGRNETLLVKNDRTKTINHDETTTVKNDRTETVNNNEKITIVKNRTETVGVDESVTVKGKRSMNVNGDEDRSVRGDRNDSVGKTYTLVATNSIEGQSKKVTINAGMEMVLQGPGGQIKIDATGVTITGVLVKIN